MKIVRTVIVAAIAAALFLECAVNGAEEPKPENECVILLHGFNKTACDMSTLDKFLRAEGYHTESPTLPTTFGTLEECTKEFEQEFPKLAGKYARIHLVGHSMGGLIIRKFLSRNHVSNLGRCVLIATPNQGTDLADIVIRYFSFSLKIFRSIEDLKPGGILISTPLQKPSPEIGVIAGSDSNLLLGKLIEGENDGRVPVDAVPYAGMTAFAVVPYGHHNIHHTAEVSILVRNFLRTGSFGEVPR